MLKRIYQFLVFISEAVTWATGNKTHVLLSAGLGMGLGLGLVVALTPPPIQAGNDFVSTLTIKRVKSSVLGIDATVSIGDAHPNLIPQLAAPAIQLTAFGSLDQGQKIVIQGMSQDYSFQGLNQARLGDEIWLLASNQGWYRFTISRMSWISGDALNDQLQASSAKLFLFTFAPLTGQTTLVEAVPVN